MGHSPAEHGSNRGRNHSLGDSLAVLLSTFKNGFARNAREDLTVELRM